MLKKIYIAPLVFFSLGANSYFYIDTTTSTIDIINCISNSVQKNGYTIDRNGIILPINAKEFAVYKTSRLVGSIWFEVHTEGRPTREFGISNTTTQTYNILRNALTSCSKNPSRD